MKCSAKLLVLSADVAQLVEHHLAKVRVAGSNPVVRSAYVGSRGLRKESSLILDTISFQFGGYFGVSA